MQFLNLGLSDETPISVKALVGQGTRSKHFKFSLPLDPEDHLEKRSHTRDIRICDGIAERLSAEGFSCEKAGRGKPRGAVLRVKFAGFTVTLMLDANRQPRYTKCNGLTWTNTLQRHPATPEEIAEGWARTRQTFENVLRESFEATSFEWTDD